MDRYTKQQMKQLMDQFRKASKDAKYQLDNRAKKYASELKKEFARGKKLTLDEESILRKVSRINAKMQLSKEVENFLTHKKQGTWAEDRLAKELEDMWKKFKNNYNSAIYSERFKLNDGRKYEFFAYVLSGSFGNFDPSDTNPAYVSGDIFTNEGDKPVHVQIKGNGGVFKMAFSDSYLRSRQDDLYKMFINNVPNFGTQEDFMNYYEKRFQQAMRKNDILVDFLENNKKEKQSLKIKKAIMSSYINQTGNITKWYVFFIAGTESMSSSGGQRLGLSFAVSSDRMIEFVEKNPKLFLVETTPDTKKGKKVLTLKFNANSINATLAPGLWGLGSSEQAYIMNGIEESFYLLRNKFDKENSGYTERYNSYVKPGGVTQDGFIEVYETVFGALKFK